MMGLDSGRTAEIVVAAAAILAVAFAGGTMTEVGEWYESLNFPRMRPPNWLFAPAWTTIYLLTAAGAIIGWEHAKGLEGRSRLVALLVVNGVLNVLWSPLFLNCVARIGRFTNCSLFGSPSSPWSSNCRACRALRGGSLLRTSAG